MSMHLWFFLFFVCFFGIYCVANVLSSEITELLFVVGKVLERGVRGLSPLENFAILRHKNSNFRLLFVKFLQITEVYWVLV